MQGYLRERAMKNLMNFRTKVGMRGVALVWLFAVAACSKSLDSIDGPEAGSVAGLVCDDLAVLSAAVEMPAIQGKLVQEGKCLNIRNRVKVEFVRTVMMPGDGKYSQFEYAAKEKTLKLWIRTSNVRGV
jgi:hypothetical protein